MGTERSESVDQRGGRAYKHKEEGAEEYKIKDSIFELKSINSDILYNRGYNCENYE